MKIYIAAPWIHRPSALDAKQRFEAAGLTVNADWITRQTDEGLSERYLAGKASEEDSYVLSHEACQDYNQVMEADTLVILNMAKSEGKATELGFATAARKRIVLVGERTINIFYHLPMVEQVQTVDEAIRLLSGAQ